jgi:hypothetical protein
MSVCRMLLIGVLKVVLLLFDLRQERCPLPVFGSRVEVRGMACVWFLCGLLGEWFEYGVGMLLVVVSYAVCGALFLLCFYSLYGNLAAWCRTLLLKVEPRDQWMESLGT